MKYLVFMNDEPLYLWRAYFPLIVISREFPTRSGKPLRMYHVHGITGTRCTKFVHNGYIQPLRKSLIGSFMYQNVEISLFPVSDYCKKENKSFYSYLIWYKNGGSNKTFNLKVVFPLAGKAQKMWNWTNAKHAERRLEDRETKTNMKNGNQS